MENNNIYGKSIEANQVLKSYKGYQANIEFSEVKVKSSYFVYQVLKVQSDELVGIIRNNPSIYKKIGLNSFQIQTDDKIIRPIQCVKDNEIYSNYPAENLFCKFKKADFYQKNTSNLTLIINTYSEAYKTNNVPLDYYRKLCLEESKFNKIDTQECIKQKSQEFYASQNNNAISLSGEMKETYSLASTNEDDRNFVNIFNSFMNCLQTSGNECKKISY